MSGLSARMLAAAAAIDELNERYDFGSKLPWTADDLRREAPVVASEDSEAAQ
ncbi:MAG: hypothetical protein VYA67_21775 [Actinomycetota bacterium]|nr:hypothetical protein [Actinomycetota bacterium]